MAVMLSASSLEIQAQRNGSRSAESKPAMSILPGHNVQKNIVVIILITVAIAELILKVWRNLENTTYIRLTDQQLTLIH